MMKKIHIDIAITSSIAVISYLHIPYISLLGIVGAIAPDWDLKLHIKHRTITHSLLLLFISSLLISIFKYPFLKKNYGLKLIKSGGAEDMFIFIVFIYLISVQLSII